MRKCLITKREVLLQVNKRVTLYFKGRSNKHLLICSKALVRLYLIIALLIFIVNNCLLEEA